MNTDLSKATLNEAQNQKFFQALAFLDTSPSDRTNPQELMRFPVETADWYRLADFKVTAFGKARTCKVFCENSDNP